MRQVDQRVGGPKGAVGQLHPKLLPGMVRGRTLSRSRDEAEPKGRLDQWREVLDVRAHHQNVPGPQPALTVSQQPTEYLPEHLHLTGSAVAGMHLDREVANGGGPSLVGRAVGADVRLQYPETVGPDRCRDRRLMDGDRAGAQDLLELPDVAPERGQQRVLRGMRRTVVRPRTNGGLGVEVSPQLRRRMRQPEMNVPASAQREQQLQLRRSKAGVPKERQSVRKVELH